MKLKERLVIAKAELFKIKAKTCMDLSVKHSTKFKAFNDEAMYYLEQGDFKRYNRAHKKYMKHMELAMTYERQVYRETVKAIKTLEQYINTLPESEKSTFIETIDEMKKLREELEAEI